MRTALYYPYTRVRSKGLLKTALLLWDRLEYISPSPDFSPEYEDSKLAEAADLICKPYIPSHADKEAAFAQISSLTEQDLPPWFYLNSREIGRGRFGRGRFSLYPDKLDPSNVVELQVKGVGETRN